VQDPESHLEKLGIQLPGATDPGASAVLEPSHRVVVNGQFYWASSPQQTLAFRASPHLYSGPVRDPVTGQWFSPTASSQRRDVGARIFYFIGPESFRDFDRDPAAALEKRDTARP
jgi:YHS domain-containing protein